jgi:hypothetical protein
MVAVIFDDQKAADWINAEDKELSRFFETSYPPFSDLKTQLRRAANFKTFIADDKSASFDIVSKINEVMDRFQEENEDTDRQKALGKLLIESIGKSTRTLICPQDFIKRKSFSQTVEDFNIQLI